MICNAITRQGYINIMLNTNYGDDIDSPISCPSDVVSTLIKVESCGGKADCKECWESILGKVKFKEDVL